MPTPQQSRVNFMSDTADQDAPFTPTRTLQEATTATAASAYSASGRLGLIPEGPTAASGRPGGDSGPPPGPDQELNDGGPGNDSWIGSDGDDTYNGLGGDDSLRSLDGNDRIRGGEGNDFVNAGGGDDTIYGDAGDDTIWGLDGEDAMYGGAGNDILGADTIDLSRGFDTMTGGSGNDTYYLMDANRVGSFALSQYDEVNESAFHFVGGDLVSGGIDTVWVTRVDTGNILTSRSSYTLADNVEIGRVLGSAAFSITGNGGANELYGNDAVNTFRGGGGNDYVRAWGGNDQLYGDDGNDTLEGWSGDDVIDGGAGNDTVYANSENDRVLGGDGDDALYGQEGNDVLNGGKNSQSSGDRMYGSIGNDAYYVDSSRDQVFEAANEGIDSVVSTVTFNASSIHVEKITLTGSNVCSAVGNSLENTIIGNAAANVIVGGLRADQLRGGAGADRFDYNAVSESSYSQYDRIYDLQSGDTIDLSGIDARSDVSGNNAFRLVDSFTGSSGQLTLTYLDASDFTVLAADVNGDGTADMRIRIDGYHEDYDNFVL